MILGGIAVISFTYNHLITEGKFGDDPLLYLIQFSFILKSLSELHANFKSVIYCALRT